MKAAMTANVNGSKAEKHNPAFNASVLLLWGLQMLPYPIQLGLTFKVHAEAEKEKDS